MFSVEAVSLTLPALSRVQNLKIVVSGLTAPPGRKQLLEPRLILSRITLTSPCVPFVLIKSLGIENKEESRKLLVGQPATVFFIPKRLVKSPSLSVRSNFIVKVCDPEIVVELVDLYFSWGFVVNLSFPQLKSKKIKTNIGIKRIGILLSNLR